MGLRNISDRAFLKRCLFLASVGFLSLTTTINAQILEYNSTFVSHASRDENGEWDEWTEWIEDNTHFEIDKDDDFITVIDDLDETIYLILSYEKSEDEEGDILTAYECMDEDFGDVTITYVERLSLEDQRSEIYIDTGEESTAYIVEQ